MARLKDIAQACGVSIATVSRVLNGHASVNKVLRERVLAVASEMNYLPNGVARSLASSTSTLIGVLVPSMSNPFFPPIVEAVEVEVSDRGFQVLLGNTFWNEHKERSYLRMMQQHRVGGLIILPTSPSVLRLVQGMPVVVLDKRIEHYVCVSTDNRAGVKLAVRHLLDLGHTRVALVGNTLDRAKYQGYSDGLAERGVDVDEDLVLCTSDTPKTTILERLFRLVAGHRRPPTAVVTFSDIDAVKIVMQCRRERLRVPQDLAVVGYDNTVYAETSDVTSVAQPQAEMGRLAAERLVHLIRGLGGQEVPSVVLQPKLVVRGSSSLAVANDAGP